MRSSLSNEPVVAVTMGDAKGIGPEVTLKALKSPRLNKKARYLVIGDGSCLTGAAKSIGISANFYRVPPDGLCRPGTSLKKNRINLIDLGGVSRRSPIRYIDAAIGLIKNENAAALVTGPVSKESIAKSGVKFMGHTEYLAGKAGAKSVAMMFVSDRLKTVLVTTHLALRKVSAAVTKKKIIEKTELAHEFLRKYYRIRNPKIGILALNPHAGDGGLLGDEDKKIIKPAVDVLRKKVAFVRGPLPADSGFHDMCNGKYDCLVCMYHDQAMIPVKMLARNRAVNVTLGLPYIRTSPVHGTAFDIARKGIADPSSMIEAMNLAARLAPKQGQVC